MAVDYESFAKYLDARKNKKVFITDADKITSEDIYKIRELLDIYPKAEVYSCIRTSRPDKSYNKFTIEMQCSFCGDLKVFESTRSVVVDIIEKGYICETCKEAEKRAIEQERHVDLEECTNEYCKNYLDPKLQWPEMKNARKLDCLRIPYIKFDKVRDFILAMDYHDFLLTPYWKAIAEYKKRRAGYRCELCNSQGRLSVHHRTYANHGDELHNMGDLIVLCQNCHEKFHNIKESK